MIQRKTKLTNKEIRMKRIILTLAMMSTCLAYGQTTELSPFQKYIKSSYSYCINLDRAQYNLMRSIPLEVEKYSDKEEEIIYKLNDKMIDLKSEIRELCNEKMDISQSELKEWGF